MSFKPIDNTTISVSGTSARKPIPFKRVQDAAGNGGVVIIGNKVRLQADGADCYFKIGDSTVVATTGDSLLQDNAIEEFTLDPGRETHIAAIGTSGTLRITLGSGE